LKVIIFNNVFVSIMCVRVYL